MDPKVAILGLACLGTLFAIRRDSVKLLGLGMAAVWCEANLLWTMDALEWLPVIELPVAMMGYAAWQFRSISVAFPALWSARLLLHVIAGLLPFGLYAHILNGLYLAALAVLAWEGGIGDAVQSIVRDGLRRFHRMGRLGLSCNDPEAVSQDAP